MKKSLSLEARLSWSRIGLYALPAAGLGLVSNLITFYLLKFSTDVLLVAPSLMGLFFGLSRIWDAVSDPLVGYWSDRTRSRLGRRRPWLLISALPLSALFAALWLPPSALSGAALAAWLGVAVVLFYTALTAYAVPHLALGAELTLDGDERTRVFGGRLALELLGIVLAAGGLYAFEQSDDPRALAWVLAPLAAVFALALAWAAPLGLHERPDFQGRGGPSPYRAFGDVLRNRNARLLLAANFLEALGLASLVTIMPFAADYLLGMQGMAGLLLGGALLVMFVTIPLWLMLSRRYGKQRVWLVSMVVRALAFAGLFLAEPGALWPTLVGILVVGSCFGCGSMIGPSLKADVIDEDEQMTGERKEGTYFASWNLAAKSASGVAIIASGVLLDLTGFEPNAPQSATAREAIRALFSGLPALFYVAAALLLARLRLPVR